MDRVSERVWVGVIESHIEASATMIHHGNDTSPGPVPDPSPERGPPLPGSEDYERMASFRKSQRCTTDYHWNGR